jgi:hypothetical protein
LDVAVVKFGLLFTKVQNRMSGGRGGQAAIIVRLILTG